MEKFTKYQNNQNNNLQSNDLYKGKSITLVGFDGWEMADERDLVLVLPYMIDRNSILLRSEYIPTYRLRTLRDKNADREFYITSICGTIESGETPEKTIRRELYEEAGIVLSSVKNIEIEDGVHLSKGNLSKLYFSVIEIRDGEYKQTIAKGDGSKEENISKTIEIPVKDLEQLVVSDLQTKYLLSLSE